MVTWPRLYRGTKRRGLAAVALFAVLAAVFLSASFGDAVGFPNGVSITASIGYALFDLNGGEVPSESMLAAFLVIALVLDAALEGALFLAKREDDEGQPIEATDGGGER
jgi:NADH-quinone oxidoreductase subunit J